MNSTHSLAGSLSAVLLVAASAAACSGAGSTDSGSASVELTAEKRPVPANTGTALPAIKTVFVIVLENHNWAAIKGNVSAPYLNGTLLTQGAHAEQYFNPPGLHPSEPNYIWLEAGDNLGIKTDVDPSASHSIPAGSDHLVAQLERAGKSWRDRKSVV